MVTAFVATLAVCDLDQYLMKVAIRGIGWLAYRKDIEDNLFGMLQADTGAK